MPKKQKADKTESVKAPKEKKEKKEKKKKPKSVKAVLTEEEKDGAHIAKLMDSKEPDLEEPEPVFPESAMGRAEDEPSAELPAEDADADMPEEATAESVPALKEEVALQEEVQDEKVLVQAESPEEAAEASEARQGDKHDEKIVVASPTPESAQIFEESKDAPTPAAEPEQPVSAPELPRVYTRSEVMKAWWQAARPPFYIATVIPLILGFLASANTVGYYDWVIFCGALLICFALHLCTNLGNDLFDHFQGTDTQDSIGGSRVLQEGKITVRQLAIATAGGYAFALALTAIGVWVTGLKGLWVIVLFGMFSSYFYVAPPIKYGYRALGELFVFLNMGLTMVVGVYYGICGEVSSEVIAMSVPIGLMVAGILYFQSLPEIESDTLMGKCTLANLLGPEKAFFLFKLWWPGIWVLMAMLYLADICAWPVLLGIALCLPVHLKACRKVDNVEEGDWFSLDKYGKLVRLQYLICGLSLVISVGMM